MNYIQKGTKAFSLTNLALFAAGFITFANLYITQPLLPQFAKEYGISPAIASLSLSVATGVLAFSLLLFGSLSEAWSRKKLMTFSIFAASALTLVLAFSPTFEVLLLLRIVQGFVFAGVPAIAMAYLGEEMEPTSLGAAMGLYISGNAIGGLSGRVIMGTMTHYFNWQVGMITLGILSLIICCYFVWALPESKHFIPRPLKWKPLTHSLLAHLKNTQLLCLFGIGFTLMGSFVTMYNYIGFKLVEPPYNLNTAVVGWIFIVYLVGSWSSAWFGSLSDKFGRQRVLYIGILIMITGVVLTSPAHLSIKVIGLVIFTFGFFGSHSIASGWVSQLANKDKAQASSLYLFAYYMGSSISGTLGGVFWLNFGWSGIILFISSALVVTFGLAMMIHFIQRTKHVTEVNMHS
ncbi:MFS transporter [Lysinibacillus sp. 2017]|uniref:MFS transporter n=1 Tax=unclassified Lysinibacillus TaxID=2636778 RepID=UPI000D525D77|nr:MULTISPECIES: MFS transporter [unclassified Lysinibacillus]AWE08018.1 MFS transporter [Lysinibacillus sp. 2017]TGN34885.1 MFS transporter [Lysinibacillus sp. S2017]